MFWFLNRSLLAVSCLFILTSCGGGDGVDSTLTYVSISIDDPSSDTVVDTSLVNLYGTASCPECPPTESDPDRCPPISCPTFTNISVSWNNLTTGGSGNAYQRIASICSHLINYYSYCEHRWSVSIPIAMGANALEVTASASSGRSDSDSTTITRVPPIPSGVTAVAGPDNVGVNWNDVPGATSYNIYWSNSRTITTDTAAKISGVTFTSYGFTGLPSDETYYFLVTAVNGDYETPASNVVWATTGWQTEAVADTTTTTKQRDTSIAMDSQGNPHIHYSYDEHIDNAVLIHNYYATNKSGTWASLFIDNPAIVNASLDVDSSELVHFGYLDFSGFTHAVYNYGVWETEVVDSQAWCNSSLAVNSANEVHVAYSALTEAGEVIRYGENSDGSWYLTTLPTYRNLGCANTGRRLSIATYGSYAYIAWADVVEEGVSPGPFLMYATNRRGVWETSSIVQGNIKQLSLAVDNSNGEAHIVYVDDFNRLMYAYNISGTWYMELIESEGNPQNPSISVDNFGKAHISYTHDGYGELRYATNTSGVWRVIPIDTVGLASPGSGNSTSIAVDSQGKAHISYFRDDRLRYATKW